jgi:hypothetical protein
MLTQAQVNEFIAELNGPLAKDIIVQDGANQALVDAVQQQTKVLRVGVLALLHGLPTLPEAPQQRQQLVRRKPL